MHISLVSTAFTLKDYGRAIRLDRLAPFLIGALIGLPLGIMLLTALDPALFKLFVGAFLIVYTAARLFLLPGLTLSGPSRARDALVGAAGGWMGGFAAIPGPLITVWCGLQGWGKDEQRAVYQPFNQAILLIALIGYGFGGLLTRELAVLCLYCVPAALAGMTLGRLGYRRLDDAQFQRVVLLLLMASGSMLVGLNALALAAAR